MHLVVFVGATVEEVRRRSIRIELETNANGVTTLSVGPHMLMFQVWHKEGEPCPKGPGEAVFDSSVVFDEGPLVSDTCGPGLERLQPYFPYPPPAVHVPPKP